MVAIVAGAGLGLERASGRQLGSQGQIGQAGVGRAGENVYVNAITGNLVIQNQDEMLIGLGPDAVISRTYNSLGDAWDANDNWRASVERKVVLTGSVNTSGSTVTRIDWDGSDVVYTWAGVGYRSLEGNDATDFITYNSGVWVWKDGATGTIETYASDGRLTKTMDRDGNSLTYTYNGSNLISRVTTQDGGYTSFVYSGTNLIQLETYNSGGTKLATRVRYGYDGSNRLQTVTVDLSPSDSTVADGKTYVTTYSYDGASRRVASIAQTDGSLLQIGYILDGGVYKVQTLTETVSSGVTRTTTLQYEGGGAIRIFDPNGSQQYMYTYSGLLTQIRHTNLVNQDEITTFSYDYDHKHLTYKQDAKGNVSYYAYDANGNLASELDPSGLTIKRTYGARNELLTETRYVVADPDITGPQQPSEPLTTRYVYDEETHLRFVISPEGRVTEYQYDAPGRVISTIDYGNNLYNVSGLGVTEAPSISTNTNLWEGVTDPSRWEFVGASATASTLSGSTAAYQLTSSGPTGGIYQYFAVQAGDYLEFSYSVMANASTTGLNAPVSIFGSVDYNGSSTDITASVSGPGVLQKGTGANYNFQSFSSTTPSRVTVTRLSNQTQTFQTQLGFYSSIQFGDPKVRIIRANTMEAWLLGIADKSGVQRTETIYNNALGNIFTTKSYGKALTSGAGDAAATGDIEETVYVYDQFGKLLNRQKVMAAGTSAESFVYDGLGRLIASTDPLNDTTNIVFYDAGRQTVVTLSNGSATTSTYNMAGELISSSVSGSGVTTATSAFRYDNLGRLKIAADASGVKTFFMYDLGGRKTADIAADGGLVEYKYDLNNQLIATVAYATKLSSSTLASLVDGAGNPTAVGLSSVRPAAHADDRWSWSVYDPSGRVIQTIDGAGGTTIFTYDGASRLVSSRSYATALSVAGYKTTPLTTVQTPSASAADRVSRTFYDKDGAVVGVLDAAGYLTQAIYDAAGRKVESIAYATQTSSSLWASGTFAQLLSSAGTSNADVRTRYVYDGRGLIRGTIDAMGGVTTFTYDKAGQPVKTVQHATLYSGNGAPSFAALQGWISANPSGNDRISRTIYDMAGRAVYGVDAEGYVTEHKYDFAGRVTKDIRYADAMSVSDGVTQGSMAAALPGAPPTTAAVTTYIYDSVGRLQETVDAEGGRTFRVYNVLSQVTDLTVGYDTSDAATTHYTYDAAGRVWTETRGYLESYASTVTYSYNAFGQAEIITDGRTYSTVRTYDAVGRLLTTSVPLDASTFAVTTNQYDAFGNLVKVTDPRGYAGHFYYDKLGRQTLQIDPEGYATATTYGLDGEVASLKRHFNATTGAAVGVPPSITAHANDATTTFTRDKLGRVTATTDAENKTESYTLNAFGDRVTVTNKLLGVTTNTYDKRGLLTQEVLPINSVRASDGVVLSATVSNVYSYDARGNRTYMLEAVGLAEQRGTLFRYDKLDRLVSEQGNDIPTVGGDLKDLPLTTPTSGIQYDRRGNIALTWDSHGAATWHFYDDLNRKVAQVDAARTLSTWTYDTNGNVLSARVYGDALGSNPTVGVLPSPVNASSYRETTYTYDRNNRRITTSVAGLRVGEYTSSFEMLTNYTATTQTVYDAAGNVVQDIDARGNSAYTYYDKLGRKRASVDREGYLTIYALDAEGNVLSETRYANQTSGANIWSYPLPAPSANDRTTTFTYDRNGRRLTEARLFVAGYGVNSTGMLYGSGATATITYTYNGLGQVTSKTEATGDATVYGYDAGGRLTSTTGAAFIDHTGATVSPIVQSFYNGLGGLTRQVAVGASGSPDRVTKYTYGPQGRLAAMTDAEGFVRSYGYDREGRVARESWIRQKSDGSTVEEANGFQYDQLGRLVFETKATKSGSDWILGDWRQTQYNAYGDVTAKGVNGLWQETFQYDRRGLAIASTAGDGSMKFFVYDKNGAMTLAITSSGTALSNYDATVDSVAANVNSPSNANATVNFYDKRGLNIKVVETSRQLSTGLTTNLNSFKTYNAFGEVMSETNARGFTTDYTYTTLGKVFSKTSPQVSVTAENGAQTNVRPTEWYYYDLSGRYIGTDNANNNRTTLNLLAGSGYGGEEAKVVAEFHPDGGVKRTGYDVFGDALKLTNEIGKITYQAYDKMSRLVQMTMPSGHDEYYAYDGLGQRIQHWNEYFGGSFKERTDYDLQGRVARTTDFEGAAITYSYAWNGSLSTNGLGTFGGWTKTTQQYGVYTAYEYTDVFGHDLGGVDYSGYTDYNYFDAAGRLTLQTNTDGKSLSYTYLNTGAVSTITDASQAGVGLTSLTTYTYDAVGNKLSESFSATRNGTTVTFQNATAVYDAMNRKTSITDTARSTAAGAYQYDATGNVRAEDGVWYKYDSMNRVVRQGYFVGSPGSGSIERVADMLYNQAGQRVRQVTNSSITENVTNWWVPAVWVPPSSGGGYFNYGVSFHLDPADIVEYFYYQPNYYDEWARDKYGNEGMYMYQNGQYGYWCTQGDQWVPEYNYAGYWEGGYYINGQHTAPTNANEIYTYNDDGYLTAVSRSKDHLQGGGETTPILWASDVRDALGRVTEHYEYLPDTATPSYRETKTYDKRSNVLTQWTGMKRGGTPYRYSETTFYYQKMEVGSWGLYYPTGTYQGGAVTGSATTSWESNSWTTAAASGITPGLHFNVTTSGSRNTLVWRDSARVAYEYSSFGGSTYTSTHTYDKNGYLTSVAVNDGSPYTKHFLTDAKGQILQRKTISGNYAGASALSYFHTPYGGGFWGSDQMAFRFDGRQFGSSENASYKDSIDDRYWGSDPSQRQSFAITAVSQGSASSSYTVRSGETLASIAAQTWGDASLWYVLAEANGLSGSGAIAPGQTLIVPNKPVRIHNNVDTFRPYDSNELVGATQPAKPKVDKKGSCGAGQIIMVIIAVVVAAYTGQWVAGLMKGAAAAAAPVAGVGAAATPFATAVTVNGVLVAGSLSTTGAIVAGAAAGALGSVASQMFGVATGLQDKINWKGVALAGISGGVGAGLGVAGPLSNARLGSAFAGGAMRGAVGSVISQRLGVTLGLQEEFSWTNVAVAGVVGGISASAEEAFIGKWGQSAFAHDNPRMFDAATNAVSGMAGAVAGASVRTLIEGSDFGDNLLTALPDVIGNTIGNMVAGGIQQAQIERAEAAATKASGSFLDTVRRVTGDPDAVYADGPGAPPIEGGIILIGDSTARSNPNIFYGPDGQVWDLTPRPRPPETLENKVVGFISGKRAETFGEYLTGVGGELWDAAGNGGLGPAGGVATEGYLAVKALGSLGARISPLTIEGVESVWKLNPFERGVKIEIALGHNLPSNFPTIDRFVNGIATSIKSLDLNAAKYQNVRTLERTLKGYVDKVSSFDGETWAGFTIRSERILSRALDLAVPRGATVAQQAAINQSVKYGATKGVTVNVIPIR